MPDRGGVRGGESLEARYQFLKALGQGGAGIVYQVRDRNSGEMLALKKLLRMDLKSVTRLKQEFRALADLHHPNLIKLYDLGRTEDAWYITMEYLDGVDLISHLAQATTRTSIVANRNAEPELLNLARICGLFIQLARGLRALHRAGKLHRDLKPSNVLVAHGRVVVLDFGLVREVGDAAITVTQEEAIVGTPAYMAPEQISNGALGPACDWYAYGVMLYEALSGVLPFGGPLYKLLQLKLEQDAQPIRGLVPQLPEELAQLCDALLSRDPMQRPGYDAIVNTLARFEPGAQLTSQHETFLEQLPSARSAALTLIGRERERAQLLDAFFEIAPEQLIAVHVRGAAGAGKTAFVERVLEALAVDPRQRVLAEPLVLRARCYEREAMPFKALDGLLDGLVDYLARLDDVLVSNMMPLDIGELARAFPVLGRLPAVKVLLMTGKRRDPVRERARAEHVMLELLGNVSAQRPLVLWIDDVQWGDLDSVRVLKSWLQTEDAPALLLVLSYRSDERETNACLRLLEQRDTGQRARELFLEIGPLTAAEIASLCAQVLGEAAAGQAALIERVVAEAQGSPFLARQLLTLAQAQLERGVTDFRELTISGWLSQLTALLSPQERALLDVLAVAGRPVLPAIALAAANILRAGSSELHTLHSMSLTRMRVVNEQRCVEIYHHRMGEALLAELSESERSAIYRRLLSALELSGSIDYDWLHLIASGAGQNEAAIRYGLHAAERAAASLAFERAAELFRDCIARSGDQASVELWRKLGVALNACGQGLSAAEAYLQAASRASPDQVVELLRLAATHLVRSGYFERGEALVRRVLSELGIKVPSSEGGLLAAIAWERARLRVRGLKFSWQRTDDSDPAAQRIAMVYSSLSIDTQSYDPLRAALFAARALRYALELGSPQLVCIAMCTMASMRAAIGSERDAKSAIELLSHAQPLAEELQQPLLLSRVHLMRAACLFLAGQAAEALQQSVEAERYGGLYLGEEEPGEYYLRSTLRATRIGALLQLSRFREARSELQAAVQDARRTGSRTALLHLSLVSALDDIAQDQAQRSRERLELARAQLPAGRFGALHLLHLVAVLRVACALGDYAWARATIDEMWPQFERSLVRHSLFAVLAYGAHARYLLNQHVLSGASGDPERLLRDDLRALHKFSDRVGPAMHTRFRARLAYLRGDLARARELFEQHAEQCPRERFTDETERASWALGRVLGGQQGAELCARAVARLRERGVVDPEAEIGSHFPELIAT